MDYIKHCRTNMQQIAQIGNTTYTAYSSEDGDRLADCMYRLREQGVLCALAGQELWVFSDGNDVDGQVTDLQCLKTGTLGAELQSSVKSGQTTTELFNEAVEYGITSRLARQDNVRRLGFGHWLFAGDDAGPEEIGTEGRGNVVLRLHLTISGNSTLFARTTTAPTELSILDSQPSAPTQVLLAPSGCQASTLALGVETWGDVVGDEDWKALVHTTLRHQGIKFGADIAWLCVQTLDGNRFTWPRKLCVAPPTNLGPVMEEYDWRAYFAADEEPHGFKHPLTIAEDWASGIREDLVAGEGMSVEATNMVGEDQSLPATSPPFVQRIADQQAAMSGIYPTPPDGLVPVSASQQQPSSDNAAVQGANGESAENQHDVQAADRQPRDRSSPDAAIAGRDGDDLFGDMSGEMDFGGGEVGDEDFDFFNADDADGLPGQEAEDMHMLEEHNATAGQIHEAEDNEHVHENDHAPETPAVPEVGNEQTSLDASLDPDTSDMATAEAVRESTPQMADSSPPIKPPSRLREPNKPLSPFGIKERLLPPPVPASAMQDQARSAAQWNARASAYNTIRFREDLDIGRRFSAEYGPGSASDRRGSASGGVDISLPSRRKKPRSLRPMYHDSQDDGLGSENESVEDSYDSESESAGEQDGVMKVPWETKKRKRDEGADDLAAIHWAKTLEGATADSLGHSPISKAEMAGMLSTVLSTHSNAVTTEFDRPADVAEEVIPPVDQLHPLSKLDLMYTAQIVTEQAVSCMPTIIGGLDPLYDEPDQMHPSATALQTLVDGHLVHLLPSTTRTDVSKLALMREPVTRPMPPQASSRPGAPRPPPRPDPNPAVLGPDITHLPAPHVRVRRGNATYEMLPPSLSFWDALSLCPVNEAKNIRGFCVYPLNEDLQRLLDSFLSELGLAYENAKLGTHQHIRNVDSNNILDDYEDGLAPVELPDDATIAEGLRAYGDACRLLGGFLAGIAGHDPNRTIVVYLLNPFSTTSAIVKQKVHQHLCAAFWLLCKSYRERMPKNMRNQPCSDLVCQLLPIELVARPDGLVILDQKDYATVAREVYDRCPPSPKSDIDLSSPLPNFCAPAVELAQPWPKRITFQLSAEPPSDLLHEGSTLHLAYALSEDGKWIIVHWTDNSGRYASSSAFSLSGRSFADAVAEVWEHTREILAARNVVWKIFIIAAGDMDASAKACWKSVVARPRKVPFSVTLLSAVLKPDLEVLPPEISPATAEEGEKAGAGLLTPGSTPQATAASSMTVSPDASGAGLNAPLTPAPSDAAPSTAETDADAHLIDTAEESWAVLFSPIAYPAVAAPADALAYGALVKRGDADLQGRMGKKLPALMAGVLWTVQVRPNGTVDEGNVKQAEMTLREVLRMYRGLSVLTKAKGLEGGLPGHVVGAVRGARALDGFY